MWSLDRKLFPKQACEHFVPVEHDCLGDPMQFYHIVQEKLGHLLSYDGVRQDEEMAELGQPINHH